MIHQSTISPDLFPKSGDFYYHYKHNPKTSINNYAYQIVGVALHSETEELLVAYKPLYRPNHVFDHCADFNVRPLKMFLETVEADDYNYSGPRFQKIRDISIINELQKLVI